MALPTSCRGAPKYVRPRERLAPVSEAYKRRLDMDTMRPLSMGADAWEGGLGSRSRSSFEYPKTSVPGFTPLLRPQLSHNFLTEIRIQLVAVVPQKNPRNKRTTAPLGASLNRRGLKAARCPRKRVHSTCYPRFVPCWLLRGRIWAFVYNHVVRLCKPHSQNRIVRSPLSCSTPYLLPPRKSVGPETQPRISLPWR